MSAAKSPTPWTLLARRIRAGLRSVRLWPALTEHQRWAVKLARQIPEAQHSDREYEEIVQVRKDRLDQCRRSGDAFGVVAEALGLVGLAGAGGRADDARAWTEVALGVLAGASEPVVESAIGPLWTLVQLDLMAYSFREAEVLCTRAAQMFASVGHVEGRLLFISQLALTRTLGWHHEGALQSCEIGDDLVRALRHPDGSPYRDSSRSLDPAGIPASQWLPDAMLSLSLSRARASAGVGRYDAAETALREAATGLPPAFAASKSVRITFARGDVAAREGRYADAEHCYRDTATRSTSPGHTFIARAARLGLGAMRLDLGVPADAVAVAKELLTRDPEDADAACLHAAAELVAGNHTEAERWARREGNSRAHPLARADAARIVGEVELARGELDAALASAERALALVEELTGVGDMASSKVLVTLARVESARADACIDARFEQALALRMDDRHPRRASVMLAFAEALSHYGRAREAEQLRDRAAVIAASRAPLDA